MRVFFIGICGTAMGNAAVLLKKMGHEVAGSDTGIYPPMSDVLADAGIDLFDGFARADMLDWQPDRVVVGNAVSRGNRQVEHLLKDRSFPFASLPQLIGEDLIGNRPSIVVAGTHGKTTTTALTAFTLHSLGLNPGFLVGGVPLDLPAGNELGDLTAPFVIEGDEYDSAFFDKRSKFIHYRPRVLVLNNLEFDHGDIFRDLEDISRSFSHLLRIVPAHGYVLRNGDDPNLLALPEAPWTQVYSVGTGENNDLIIADFGEDQTGSRFTLIWRGEPVVEVNWAMPGLFNARNLTMAIFASCLTTAEKNNGGEIDATIFQPMAKVSFGDCRGVKRRQEVLLDSSPLVVLSDFAHHPTAISGALESLRARYPGREVIACFEPRSNTAVTNVFEDRFAYALALADQALIGAVHRAERIPEAKRISPVRMVRIITKAGKLAHAFDSNQELGKFLSDQSKSDKLGNTLLVFFSNGSFDGVIQEFVERAKARLGMPK